MTKLKQVILKNKDTGQVIRLIEGDPAINEWYGKGFSYAGDGRSCQSNYDLAQSFCQTESGLMKFDQSCSTFWRYRKDRGTWEPYERHQLRAKLGIHVKGNDFGNKITTGKLDDISQQCADSFAERIDDMRDTHLAFRDCLLDLKTLETCDKSPETVASVYVDCDYADLENAPSPMFDDFMATTCVGVDGKPEPRMFALLQECAGYLLSGKRGAKSFFFYGPSRTGKSVFLNLLRSMVGAHRTTSATIAQLCGNKDKFAKASLRSKKANMNDDDQSLSKISGEDLGDFKKLVANEPLSFRDLFERETTARLWALLIWCANKPVVLSGWDDAIRKRLVPVRFPHVMPDALQDTELSFRIHAAEAPAVVRFALAGLKRLIENNFVFSTYDDTERLLIEMEGASNSALDFINEFYEPDEIGLGLPATDVYKHYVVWCDEYGREAMSHNSFGRAIAQKGIIGLSGRDVNGKCCRMYHCRRKPTHFLDYVDPLL
ncbi:MAG: phage/plasmid primase, P4 family [Sphaerochaeta sp.]|jgi:P4 family phage/plasmid primase-like protien|nr:phage/plasmid primase, P4 family [Sphaerochaeta sp.]